MDPVKRPDSDKESDSQLEHVSEKQVLDFGGDAGLPPPPKLTAEEEQRLYRKIDFRHVYI